MQVRDGSIVFTREEAADLVARRELRLGAEGPCFFAVYVGDVLQHTTDVEAATHIVQYGDY